MNDKQEALGINLKEYLNDIVENALEKYEGFIKWTEKDKNEFKNLLDEVKRPFNPETETTKDKGDKLEKLVEFIIKKTYFFELYKNVHTETNEIDEVIVFSNRGKQAISMFNLSRQLIPVKEDIFLGECKNYKGSLGVTYVGKFYSLMKATGVNFGIIFTQNGLTGEASGYKDAYGLTKVLRLVEKSQKEGNDFYIITFTMEDYEKMLNGTTFFKLIEAKKMSMDMAADYNAFIRDNQHEAEKEIRSILNGLKEE